MDFYVRVLGIRFLKRTVNFDDPGTYHLYFGDYTGTPGTALTFFAWKGLPPGNRGQGQTVRVGFKVPGGSLDRWRGRIEEWRGDERFGAWEPRAEEHERFGRRVLELDDPDGLGLALVERGSVDEALQWTDGPVETDMAIAGFHGVVLTETGEEPTTDVLRDVLGLERGAEDDGRIEHVGRAGSVPADAPADDAGARNTAPLGPRDTTVELEVAPSAAPGRVARGSIHHIAFRATDDEHQDAVRSRAAEAGLSPTEVIDRYYFRSVYFREPGGALFEVATDEPGFTRDQAPGELGRGLTLPPWLESRRQVIEARLDPVDPPDEEDL